MLTCIHGVIASSGGDQINTWGLVGSKLTIGLAYKDITALSSTDVITSSYATPPTIKRYTFNGSTWSEVGSSYSLPSMAALSTPLVTALTSTSFAYIDNDNNTLRTYAITGDPSTTISQTGNTLTIGEDILNLDALSSTRIAVFNDTINEIQAYDFDGTDWTETGTSLSWLYGNGKPAAVNSTDIIIYDTTNYLLRKYSFDGSTWTQTGTGASLPGISGISTPSDFVAMSETRIAVVNGGTEALWLYDISAGMSTPATLIGEELEILSSLQRITKLTSSELAHCDYAYGQLATYEKPI